MVLKRPFISHTGNEKRLCLVIVQVSQKTELFESVRLYLGDVFELTEFGFDTVRRTLRVMVPVVVSWYRTLQVGRAILGRWSLNCRKLSHYIGGDCSVTVDS